MIQFSSISFIENGDVANGHFFYNSASDSDYGKICGVKGLTLPKALAIMKAKGVDVIKNPKINVACYYGA